MEAVAGRARAVTWLGFFALVLAAWALAWSMTAGAALDWLCRPVAVAALPLGGFPALFAMWAAMTAAMMLPTFVPTLAAYLRLPGRARGAYGSAGLVAGFLGVWMAGALLFAGAQAGLIRLAALDLSGALVSPLAGGALLAGAGLWQFTRAKAACQTACLRPELRFIARLRPGLAGGFAMGAETGAFCFACCWALMALAFVGGVMSLLWMGIATLFMVLEKLPDLGERLRRPAGLVMIAAGLALAAGGGT